MEVVSLDAFSEEVPESPDEDIAVVDPLESVGSLDVAEYVFDLPAELLVGS